MRKNKTFFIIFLYIFSIILLLAGFSFAVYSNVKMSVESNPEIKLYMSEDSYLEKKLVSQDLENKQVTLQLSVNNNEKPTKPTGELVIVLDNSDSMTETTSSNKTRTELIHESAKNLISSCLSNNEKLKIGVVAFSTNINPELEGTIQDAKIVSNLSNDASAINTSIDNIQNDGPATNLSAGLTCGKGLFSDTINNKFMIVLTDGVPNVAIDYDGHYFSDDAITKSKNALLDIKNSGIKLFTMLTGISNPSSYPYPGYSRTYEQIITETFGTPENPTAGKFYYITDSQIEKTITEDISNDLSLIYRTLKDLEIKDYFPEYIIQNFDLNFEAQPTHGSVSKGIVKDENNKYSISWTIPELPYGETAYLKIIFKLKEDYSSEILEKLLNTNENLELDYNDLDGNPQKKSTVDSPKLKLVEPTPEPTPVPTPEPTLEPTPEPTAEPTSEPETPKPTAEPTPEPETPKPTATPVITPEPTPEPTPVITPLPIITPEPTVPPTSTPEPIIPSKESPIALPNTGKILAITGIIGLIIASGLSLYNYLKYRNI